MPRTLSVGNRDDWAVYSGASWAEEAGFFYRGFARRASTVGDSVTVEYHCQFAHDLELGTSLYTDRGIWEVSLDSDTATDLDMYLAEEPPVATRRKLRTAVAAGEHSVTLTLKSTKNAASSGFFAYFDFLEAVIEADVPDAAQAYTDVSVATDYDTDHTYKLPPQRLLEQIDWSGLRGDINHFIGVFFQLNRKRVGGTFPSVALTFGGTWASGDTAFVVIGGVSIGKSVFPADTTAAR